MCAVEDRATGVVDDLSLDSLSGGDEGSSSLSSIAEEDISDLEVRAISARSKRVKLMCSYGGRILPRPHDNQLRYTGGETRILVVKKGIGYKDLMAKLSHLAQRKVLLKYQLLNEDLDALISVTSDEDVANMMEEYDRMVNLSYEGASVKLRVFLFPKAPPLPPPSTASGGEASEYYSSDESVVSHPLPKSHSTPTLTSTTPKFTGSKHSVSPLVFATPPLGSKVAKQQQHSARPKDEFGSLKYFQQQQQHQDHFQQQRQLSDEIEHMFYQVNQHHHPYHHHDTSSNGDAGHYPRSPCRCSVDPSLLLPPRHPHQKSYYHQAAPPRNSYWNGYCNKESHYQPQHYHRHHADKWS